MADISVKLMTQGKDGEPFYPITHAICVLMSDGGNMEAALSGKATKEEVRVVQLAIGSKYSKPEGGIPLNDLAEDVKDAIEQAANSISALKTVNGESLVGEGDIVVLGVKTMALTKTEKEIARRNIEALGASDIAPLETKVDRVEGTLQSYLLLLNTVEADNATTKDLVEELEWKLGNIKTINGVSILGSGNINIAADGHIQAVDLTLSRASDNPIANSAVAEPIEGILANIRPYEASEYEDLKNRGVLQDKLYFVLEEA